MSNLNIKKIILIITLTIMLPVFAAAQGSAFNFQGRLNDGANPANGAYDLQFQLYDAITGGTQIGSTVPRPNTALINGVFSVTLDFGATAFNNPSAVFIEIGVRPAGSPNAFTILGPRQQLTVVPYAVRSNDSARLGGIAASDYITNASNSFIKNSTTAQPGDFNILGDGLVGRRLGVGFGSFADPNITFDVIGNSRFRSSTGGSVEIGTPNGETGLSVIRGQGRGDIRFNGAYLRLVAGSGLTPPTDANGISISTQGNVGIGSTAPLDAKLYVSGKLSVDGNVTQPTWKRGLPKAMIRVFGGPDASQYN